jgi:purine-binding chemotaxis protein CheW
MSTENNKIQTYLSFKMAEEVFAINVSQVINILEMRHITRVPKTPSYMKGVINLRGTVLPVVDLRIKFGIPEQENTVDTSIIVINIEKDGEIIMLGTLVDAVREVLELNDEDIAPSPNIGTKYNSGFIHGMYRMDEHFIMILNIDKIFSVDEILDVKDHLEKNGNIESGKSAAGKEGDAEKRKIHENA